VSRYFRQPYLTILCPNGVVGTETLILEEEDEDDYLYTTNNAEENNQT
jgi:phage/plasmid-associated DNA primase